jgi:hypothetical protein
MTDAPDKTNKFLNSREWRTFLSAAQSAATCPCVQRAVKAGQAWLSERGWLSESPVKASGWRFVDGTLPAGPHKTLGV